MALWIITEDNFAGAALIDHSILFSSTHLGGYAAVSMVLEFGNGHFSIARRPYPYGA